MPASGRNRVALFLAICVACIGLAVGFALFRSRETRLNSVSPTVSMAPKGPAPPRATQTPEVQPKAAPAVAPSNVQKLASKMPPGKPAAEPMLYFRADALGPNYGKLAVAPLNALDRPRYSPDLSCERLYFAGGKGVCLVADRGMFTKYYAVLFDRNLHGGRRFDLNGEPSRVRVAPSGRLAAITVFISGHSYASLAFSTQTTILNTVTGAVLCDLEQFAVYRDNQRIESPDFNFWGVTFKHDENQFFATLWSKSKTYLVDCNLAKRTANVLHEGVECPSLSPNNTRIAFKKRIPAARVAWGIAILDLKTGEETLLNETRNVDDQVEWLDNNHILYSLSQNPNGASASTDIWELAALSGSTPQLFLRGAYSPSVVRIPIRTSVSAKGA